MLTSKFEQNASKQEQTPKFNFDETYAKFKDPESGLIFLKMLGLFGHIPINNDENTWHGVTNTTLNTKTLEETVNNVVIGTKKIPPEIAELFGWGVENADHEFAIKAAHEISHVYQISFGFTHDLIRYKTEGANFKPRHGELSNATYGYIYLYDLLDLVKNGTGNPATGLASHPVYHYKTAKHKQNVVEWGHSISSALDEQILEDITELMGAYALGEEYFDFRLNNMNIEDSKKSTVRDLIASILPA